MHKPTVVSRLSALGLSSLLALGLAVSPAARASPVVYSFAGSVDADSAERGWERFSGEFRFDSGASDGIADTSTGAYAHAGAPWGMSLSFFAGASLVQTVTLDTLFHLLLSNDLGGEDQLGLLAQDSDPAHSLSLTLLDTGGTAFASDALPLPAGGLTLALFPWSSLLYESAEGVLQGRLDALACSLGCEPGTGPDPDPNPPTPTIPEPSSWALLLAAGLALLGSRARPKPHQGEAR